MQLKIHAKSPIIQRPELPVKHVEQTSGLLLHPKYPNVKTEHSPEIMGANYNQYMLG